MNRVAAGLVSLALAVVATAAPTLRAEDASPTLSATVADRTVLVGECVPVTLTLRAPGSGETPVLRRVNLDDDTTALVLRSDSVKPTAVPGGIMLTVQLMPLRPGPADTRLVAQVMLGRRAVTLTSAPVRIRAESAPESGRPAGYAGAVGVFRFGTPAVAGDNSAPGRPLRLELPLYGTGALERVGAPELKSDDWTVVPEPASLMRDAEGSHMKRFNWTLSARRGGELETPGGSLVFLDPATRTYRTLAVPTLAVVITGASGTKATDSNGREFLTAEALTPVTETRGFLAANALAAVVCLAASVRAWRRLSALRHPERKRRRDARRALRELRTRHHAALRSGDAAAAETLALNALRIVVAADTGATADALTLTELKTHLTTRCGVDEASLRWVSHADRRRHAPAREIAEADAEGVAALLNRLERTLR